MRSWTLPEIPSDVRALAEEAAREAELPIGVWLARAIHQQREEEGAAEAEAPNRDTAADISVVPPAVEPVAAPPSTPSAGMPSGTMSPQDAIRRFLTGTFPDARDVPIAALKLSRFHGDIGLMGNFDLSSAGVGQGTAPVIARPALENDGDFEIVTGLVRWRAAEAGDRESLPVVVLDLVDRDAIRLMLIETLTTTRLPPIAEAEAYRWLMRRGAVSEDELVVVTGKSRGEVREQVALLQLPASVLERIDAGALPLDRAGTLLEADYADVVSRLSMTHSLTGESVREVVALTNRLGSATSAEHDEVAKTLGAILGTEVRITRSIGSLALTLDVGAPDGRGHATYRLPTAEND